MTMNFIKHFSPLALLAAIMLLGGNSCDNNKPATAAPASDGSKNVESMTIRYIDEDSIMANYNLAKDINEAMLRRQNQYDAAQKQRGNEINKLLQRHASRSTKNNQYLTEEAV